MHSNYNLKNINHHTNFDISDNGFYYLLHGMKLLSPKRHENEHGPSAESQELAASYQTASNAAFNARHNCNVTPCQQHEHEHDYGFVYGNQCNFHHQHRRNHSRKQNQAAHKKHSPPPLVHQCAKKITRINDNNKFQHYHPSQQQQPPPTSEQQILQSPRKYSTDKHYHHYYSYYYNRQIDCFPNNKSSNYLPLELMESLKNNPYIDEGVTTRSQDVQAAKKQNISTKYTNGVDAEDNKRNGTTHVLKEGIAHNNNILLNYSNDKWLKKINQLEVLSTSADFLDAKDFNVYDNFNLTEPKDAKIQFKRKQRTRSESETQEVTKLNSDCSYVLYPTVNNNQCNGVVEQAPPAQKVTPYVENKIKLPETPNKVKGAAAKKPSPPVHRVIIYNSQSPRLPRTCTTMRQELRRVRMKSSPLFPAKNKQHSHRVNEHNKTESPDYVSTWNAGHRVPGGKADKTKSVNVHLKKPVKCNASSDLGGGDADRCQNNNDSDDNVSDIDDAVDDMDNVVHIEGSGDSDTSTDSEDGYRTHAFKMTHCLERVSVTQSYLSSQTSEESIANPNYLLVPSLFPNVPPYLAFSSNTHKGPDVPPELYRIMKWKISSVMPKVVRCVLTNSGMRLLKKTNDWMGTWGKHMKSPCFKTIRPYQKINHLPGSFKIGRKDACWRNLQKLMIMHGRRDFGFMPRTYIIPSDIHLLRKNWPKYAQRNVKWIIKPPASARGAGIRVVNRWAQIPKRRPLIVQKYIERPLLINGSKFDLRLYVLVTSINPLRVYMYHNGLARFASVKYSDKSETLNDRCMHLTNYSINKFSSNYAKNEDVNACHGHKWTIKSLWTYLANRGVRTDFLWAALRNLVLRTLLAGEQSINNMIKLNVESKYSCFELFGFDILLDSDLIPWLLEVNISPSLHSELPLDAHVKAPLVQGVLNTALYNVPPKLTIEKQLEIAAKMSLPVGPICYDKRMYVNYLSREEKIKHNTFTRKSMEERDEYIKTILDNLTPDDVRCLIVAEDELARSTPLERIFPTNETYKYLKYTDTPRYYNRLLDAWENRYAFNREVGIDKLRDFCAERYHLRVPPPPAKKYFEDDDTTYYLPTEQEQENTTTPAGLYHQISEMDIKIIVAAIVFVMVASVTLCAISLILVNC